MTTLKLPKPSGFEANNPCPFVQFIIGFKRPDWLVEKTEASVPPIEYPNHMTLENREQIENVQQYYEILRTRQMQIIEIIRDTSQMLSKLDSQQNKTGGESFPNHQIEKNLDNGIRLAFGMINALANILDEQMNALNVWERILQEDRTVIETPSRTDYRLQDYYEITSN